METCRVCGTRGPFVPDHAGIYNHAYDSDGAPLYCKGCVQREAEGMSQCSYAVVDASRRVMELSEKVKELIEGKFAVWSDEFGKHRAKIVVFDGMIGCDCVSTSTCTGCYDSEDGHPVGDYPWDAKAGCHIGAGCEECGYTGKSRGHYFAPLPKEAIASIRKRFKIEETQ